jgi:DNA-binding IclR family transcriptional regulator
MAMISGQDPALTAPGGQRLAARAPSPNTLAVERALQLLLLVMEHQQGASLQQLARQVGCSKSTVFRLLATMERLNAEQELQDNRGLGYAYSLAERAPGSSAISAPILDLHGRVRAALSVSGPAFRFTPARAMRSAPALLEATGTISAALAMRSASRERGHPHRGR